MNILKGEKKPVHPLNGNVREPGTKVQDKGFWLWKGLPGAQRKPCAARCPVAWSALLSTVWQLQIHNMWTAVSSQCTHLHILSTEATGNWRSAPRLTNYVNHWDFGLDFWSVLNKTCRLMPGGLVQVFNPSIEAEVAGVPLVSLRPLPLGLHNETLSQKI